MRLTFLMFSLNGDKILELHKSIVYVAIPLVTYLNIRQPINTKKFKVPYNKNASISFTAPGNNFESAIDVAVAVFGTLFSSICWDNCPYLNEPVLILLVGVNL